MTSAGDTADLSELAFQAAWDRLDEAAHARDEIGKCWTSLCDTDAFDSAIVIEDDRHGRLDVFADWPGSSLRHANDAALRFAAHVKGAFDEALLVTAQRVSGVIKAADPDAHRMPLCGNVSELAAHVAGGGLRGIRPDQIRMVEQFQPYAVAPQEVGAAELLRVLMRHLAEMVAGSRELDRPRVAVWAHSAAPEIFVDTPGELIRCESTGDGVLERARTVARFTFAASGSPQIQGNPAVAFDLIFNDEPYPVDPDDNLMARSAGLMSAAREFIRSMERSLSGHVSSRSSPRPMSSVVRSADGSPWGQLDLESFPQGSEIETALAGSDLGLALHYDADGNITMLLRSGASTYGRPIPPALPLDPNLIQGTAAEHASLAAAAMWGLPDFVMRPRLIRKGTGWRELGDGTIISGRRGLAIQVKSRESEAHDLARETRWVLKKAAEGARQARGSVRSLRAGPVDLVNGRGRTVRYHGGDMDWVGVVILDHPSSPGVVATPPAAPDLPIVVLLRRDWDFLFDQLRSVSAVVDYVHRVAQQEPQALGREIVRYYELAQADEDASAGPPAAWITELGAQQVTQPILPKAPASSADTTGHTVFRIILEEIAAVEIERAEEERLQTLALIDRFSVGDRADLGRMLLGHLDDVMEAPTDSTMWRFRRVIQDDGTLQLAFGACSQFTELHREAFRQWAMLRHHDFMGLGVAPAGETPKTVAVLLTPRHDGYRPWDTTMIAIHGDLELEPEEVASMRMFWSNLAGAGD